MRLISSIYNLALKTDNSKRYSKRKITLLAVAILYGYVRYTRYISDIAYQRKTIRQILDALR